MYVNRGRVSESNKIIPTSGQYKIIHPDESESWLPGLSHIQPTPKNIVLGREYVKGWQNSFWNMQFRYFTFLDKRESLDDEDDRRETDRFREEVRALLVSPSSWG